MKKGVVFGVIGLVIFVLILAIPISNDLMAKKVVKKIEDTPLPEKTEYVESVYLAGKLVGNGNGMQYFGAILIKSEQSLDELMKYYEDYNDDNWQFFVEKQRDNIIQIIEHGDLSFQTNINSDTDYYIVYSWGEGNSFFDELDIRGH